MTKLEALNKIVTEKLAGTKEGKTILESVNLATKAYGGTGDASNLGDAIEQLYSVFTKGGGGGGGGDEHATFDFSRPLVITDEEYPLPLSIGLFQMYAQGAVSYKDIDLSKTVLFPSLAYCKDVTSVDFTGIKNTDKVKYFHFLVTGTSITNIDLTPIDFTGLSEMRNAFALCKKLKTVDMSMITKSADKGTFSNLFTGCSSLETVNMSNIDLAYISMFDLFEGCTSLTHVTFKEGVDWFTSLIGPVDFSYSPVDRETIIQLFNNLCTWTETSTPHTIVLNPTTLGYLSEEDKAIATNKGWTIT